MTLARIAQLEAELDTERAAHRATLALFRAALKTVGIAPESIERIVANDEIESDYLTTRDFDMLTVLNRAGDAESEVSRLRSAMSVLQEDYAKLDACHRQNLEILHAYAPGSVVRLGA